MRSAATKTGLAGRRSPSRRRPASFSSGAGPHGVHQANASFLRTADTARPGAPAHGIGGPAPGALFQDAFARGQYDLGIGHGTFDVAHEHHLPVAEDGNVELACATLDKTFHGALEATSRVHDLSVSVGAHTACVRVERIDGTLHGKVGSFVVTYETQTSAWAHDLLGEIVEGTGTGELAGIVGTLRLDVFAGNHFYTIDYTLP